MVIEMNPSTKEAPVKDKAKIQTTLWESIRGATTTTRETESETNLNEEATYFEATEGVIDSATSTTTLGRTTRLDPKYQPVVKTVIKNQRTITKAEHHISLLQDCIERRDPPRGLKPNINPRIPSTKTFEFLREWEENMTEFAINCCRIIVRQWKIELEKASEQLMMALSHAKTVQSLSPEEELEIETIREHIKDQITQDLKRKKPRPQNRPIANVNRVKRSNSTVSFQDTPTTIPVPTTSTGTSTATPPPSQPKEQRRKTEGSKLPKPTLSTSATTLFQ